MLLLLTVSHADYFCVYILVTISVNTLHVVINENRGFL